MQFLRKKFVALVFPALLLVISAMLIGPVVWRWGRREIVRLQSRGQWEKLCANSQHVAGDGDPCGWLKIPSCGIDTIVLSGGSKQNLAKSICMESMGQEAWSGDGDPEMGLRVISGHRDTHFRKLRNIVVGNEVALSKADGSVTQYRVVDIDVIPKDNLDEYVNGRNHPDWIALLTCYPFGVIGSAPERFVVWCTPF